MASSKPASELGSPAGRPAPLLSDLSLLPRHSSLLSTCISIPIYHHSGSLAITTHPVGYPRHTSATPPRLLAILRSLLSALPPITGQSLSINRDYSAKTRTLFSESGTGVQFSTTQKSRFHPAAAHFVSSSSALFIHTHRELCCIIPHTTTVDESTASSC